MQGQSYLLDRWKRSKQVKQIKQMKQLEVGWCCYLHDRWCFPMARQTDWWIELMMSHFDIDSQLPSLISLFIFVWSISETAVVSLYMGGLIVWRPSAQPKLAADHVSLWISPPLYMRMNLQCELGRCVHHIGGGVHFYVNLGQNCLHQNWGKCISRET